MKAGVHAGVARAGLSGEQLAYKPGAIWKHPTCQALERYDRKNSLPAGHEADPATFINTELVKNGANSGRLRPEKECRGKAGVGVGSIYPATQQLVEAANGRSTCLEES